MPAGRKPGSINRATAKAREEAAKTGELPHEFLLRVTRGERIGGYEPTFPERIDAAKACAQFFAPKFTATQVQANISDRRESVREYSTEELLAIIEKGRN